MKFEFNEKALNKALNEIVKGVPAKVGSAIQQVVDDVHATHAGRPVEEVKAALSASWRSTFTDGSITDPQLTEYATMISEGKRIKVEVQ